MTSLLGAISRLAVLLVAVGVLVTLALRSLDVDTHRRERRFQNGQIERVWYEDSNGDRHGTDTWYNEDGTLVETHEWTHGDWDSTKQFWPNGKVSVDSWATWTDRKERRYDENGKFLGEF